MKTLSVFCALSIAFMMFTQIAYANKATSKKAEEMIERHLQASGGEAVLMKMQSISRDGQITFYQQKTGGENLCYHTDIIYPKKLREQIKGEKIEYDRGTDGNIFWLWNGSKYDYTQDQQVIAYMRDTAEHANRDMLWVKQESDNWKVILTVPSWAPKHSKCIQEIKSKKTTKRTYCFDTSTGLLNALGNKKEYRLESDWRSVGNIKLPFRLMHYQNGVMIYEVRLNNAELDKKISDAQFFKPTEPQLACIKS